MTAPALVLLPGLDGTGLLFRPLLAALPPRCDPRVVAYPVGDSASYEEALPRVLEALPRSGRFVMLSESYSGPLALKAAALQPDGLAGVVLCATFVSNPQRLVSRRLAGLVRPWLFRWFPTFTQVKALLGGYATPELRLLSRDALSKVEPSVLAARVRSILAVDVEAELRDCAVPVLYLRGERDRVVPLRNLRRMQQLLPSMEVSVLPAPHLVLQTQPVLAAKRIVQFLDDLDSDAGAGAADSRASP